MIVLLVLVVVQFLFSLTSSGASSNRDPNEGTLDTFVKSVSTKRVALVIPLHDDQTKTLTKRFNS